jgi:hypothetical protein
MGHHNLTGELEMTSKFDTFTMQDRQALHDFLIGLPLTTGESDPRTAICSSVKYGMGVAAVELFRRLYTEEVLEEWEHYTGWMAYPVPVSSRCKSPVRAESAFDKAAAGKASFWSTRSEYGHLRRDLARHLAQAALTWGIES